MNYGFSFIAKVIAALIAITAHENIRAWTAFLLGDKSQIKKKMITFNLVKHVDPIGLISLLFLGCGWSKPIAYVQSNFKKRKKATVLIAISGILEGFIVAFIAAIIVKLISNNMIVSNDFSSFLMLFMNYLIFCSISISLFDFIPYPPLAMSKIISVFSPRLYFKMLQKEKTIRLIFVFMLFLNVFSMILFPIVEFISKIYFSILLI